MNRDDVSLILANRSFLYGLLARGYAEEPDMDFLATCVLDHTCEEVCLIEDEHTFPLLAAFNQVVTWLQSDTVLSNVHDEYMRIFVGPETLKAPPFESVCLSGKRILFQPEILDVRALYRQAGFLPSGYPRVADDHISIECDYLAKLAAGALDAWLKKDQKSTIMKIEQSKVFLEQHLARWIDEFARAIEKEYGDCFYGRFTKFAALVVQRDESVVDRLLLRPLRQFG